MDGYPARIDSRHPGRGHDGHLFSAMLTDIFKESCFTRTGFAGKKYSPVRLIDQIGGQGKKLIRYVYFKSTHSFATEIIKLAKAS